MTTRNESIIPGDLKVLGAISVGENPTPDQEVVTKEFVLSSTFKDSVRVATIVDVTLSGLQTIDGVSLVADDRVLVKNQSIGSENGIYVVSSGAWTRSTDFDTSEKVAYGTLVFSEQGTVNGDIAWKLSTDNVILDTTSLVFVSYGDVSTKVNRSGDTMTGTLVLSGNPVGVLDATPKQYVDALIQGLDIKYSVKISTTSPLPAVTYNNGTSGLGATLTADVNGALPSQDGVSLSVNDRILIKDQVDGLENGIYEVTQVGDGSNPFILTRTIDADNSPSGGEVTPGMFTFVEEGTENSDSGWVLTTNGTITIGTTALTFSQFSGAGQITAGNGLTKTGNILNVATADVSRIVVNADNIDLATTGVSAGTFTKFTVDLYGRLTNATDISTLDITTALGYTPLKNVTDTLTGILTVTGGIVTASPLDIDGVVSNRDIRFKTSGVQRWVLRVDITTEGGSDTGSDFNIISRNDAGSQIDIPLSIVRAAGGSITLARPSTVTGLITANDGIFINGGTGGSGRIVKSTTQGFLINGITGSTNDFALRSVANNTVMRIPTGTSTVNFPVAVSMDSTLTGLGSVWINANNAYTSYSANALLQISRDGDAHISSTSFGGNPLIAGRRANGTFASQTAVGNGDTLLALIGFGHDSVSINGTSKVRVEFNAIETWTESAAGTEILLITTPIGSITRATVATFRNALITLAVPVSASSTLSVTGVTTLSSRLTFDTNASGAVGSLWKSSGSGLVLQGVTASVYDLSILNPAAQSIFRNPTGTQTANFPGAVIADNTLYVAGIQTNASDIVLTQTLNAIRTDTSDGSDTKAIRIGAGNLIGLSRSAVVSVYGNEHATEGGRLYLSAGTVGTGDIYFTTNGSIRLTIANGGTSTFTAAVIASTTLDVTGLQTNAGNIRFSSTEPEINKSNNTGRVIITSGTGNNGALGAVLRLEGADYTGVGLGGNVQLTAPGITKLFTISMAISVAGTASFSSSITQTGGATSLSVDDNQSTAFEVKQGSNGYLHVRTTNTAELITIGNSTTNPSYTFLGSGTFTISGATTLSSTITVNGTGNHIFGGTVAATTNHLQVSHTDNTTTSSTARISIQTGGSAGGDPYLGFFIVGQASLRYGLDNSDNDALVWSTGADLGTSNIMRLSLSGDLTILGNSRLGLTTTSACMALGQAVATDVGLYISESLTGLTSADPKGLISRATFGSSATTAGTAGYFQVRTAAASFTMPNGYGVRIPDAVKGASSNITILYGLKVEDQTQGGTNYSIYTGVGGVRFGNDTIIIATTKTPASAADTGTQGMVAWDSGFIYVCTATNTWKRAAIATW